MEKFFDIIPPKEIRREMGKMEKKTPAFAQIFKRIALKAVCLLVILGLNWTGLSAIIETFAYLNDTEDSLENTFVATTLDFSLNAGSDFTPEVTPTQNSVRNISVIKDGVLDFEYNLKTENETGYLCDYLNLTITRDGVDIGYAGNLKGFTYDAGQFSDPDNWQFTASLIGNDPSLENETCAFDFVFDGSQIGSAGFSDQEIISNIITSGQLIVKAGDVVINELMWMGSFLKPKDEWIELRNMTFNDIDLSGWQLTKLVNQEKLMLTIPNDYILPANGFFLISNFDKNQSNINVVPDLIDNNIDLRNNNLQIKLYKGDWTNPSNLIDVADDGHGKPLAGFLGFFGVLHFSMERKDIPGDGTSVTNWHTCWDDSLEMKAYWDNLIIPPPINESINRGTPGGRNLSDYDEIAMGEYYQDLENQVVSEGIIKINIDSENYEEENIVGQQVEEQIIEEVGETEEQNYTTTGENQTDENQEEGEGIIEEINEIIDEVIDEIVDEIMPNEETGEEVIEEPEIPVIEDVPIIEEVPADETPAVEEQPAVVPDDSSSNPDGAGESVSDGGSGDGGGETGGGSDSGSPTEGAGESL